MKELLGIILLTLLVVLGSCNSNTNVSLMETSPQLFGVRQVSSGNPDYRNRELFINELEKKCKYPIEFQKNNLEVMLLYILHGKIKVGILQRVQLYLIWLM